MGLELVEPLRELFKDEVRALGRELGLPEAFVGRHPFPGPGLAIRIPARSRRALDVLRQADAIYLEELRAAGLDDADLAGLRRAPAGAHRRRDGRRADLQKGGAARRDLHDGMTADFSPLPHELLGRGVDPDHQRGQGGQPGGLRRDEQAAGDNRVGVGG